MSTTKSSSFSVANRANIVKSASKFKSYSDFIKNGKNIYDAALYYDCIEEIKNMFNIKQEKIMKQKNLTKSGKVDKRIKWTSAKQVMKAVRACKNTTEWQSTIYEVVRRFGLLKDAKQVFIDRKNPTMTKEQVFAEAAKYSKTADFQAHSTTAYRIFINNQWEDEYKNYKNNKNLTANANVVETPVQDAKTVECKVESKPTNTNNTVVTLDINALFAILASDKYTTEQKNIALKHIAANA